MSLFTASLNSGSNGNCYYVGNGHEGVLVDAGISCRETEQRLKKLGIKMEQILAIFISHEHGDHIKGIEGIVAKYHLPVYITDATFRSARLRIPPYLQRHFTAGCPIVVGGLSVTAFPKWHDAVDPHSFVVSCDGINVGVFTDIGAVCEHTIHHFQQCHAVFLESNYDEQLLFNGRYSAQLKRRIHGQYGHLSNLQALELFSAHRTHGLSHIFLSHLSKENNKPEIALQLFTEIAGNTHVSIASRFEVGQLFTITGKPQQTTPLRPPIVLPPQQMSLF